MGKRLFHWQGALPLVLLLVVSSCSLFEYHPYEVRLDPDELDLNAKAIATIQSGTPSDTLSFILIGDSQRFYDETERFITKANELDPDFTILAGDISDFGLDVEFKWVNDIMKKLHKPYVAVIGNHDLTGQGEAIFRKMYGPLDDAFVVDKIKFILINTNSREYTFSGDVPNLPWLTRQLSTNDFSSAIVVGHIAPFESDFDPALEAPYARMISESGKVLMSLHAHRHDYYDAEHYEDGVRYVISAAVDDLFFVYIRIKGNYISVEQVFY